MKDLGRYLWLVGLLAHMGASPLPAADAGSHASRPDHWAFQAPIRPAWPRVQNSSWVRNGIDYFILARLEAEGLTPAPEADRRTLIRRLSLDLLGLPPAPEQVEAFVNDPRPDAYDHWVDRLLAAPQFGERWARHWLDLARYADSDGYEKDSPRPYAYLFRDWVIRAINDDLPFDQFTIEQLAGDLLPNATHDQKVATGFHRNTLTNKEGGVDQEEFRCKATVDRASTTATVWLGLTLACAECHNHKYDPITQREFYQFYAFFNSASEKDIPSPTPVEWARYQAAQEAWEQERRTIQERLTRYLERQLPAKQAQWEASLILARDQWKVAPRGTEECSPRPLFHPEIPDRIREWLDIPADARSAEQRTAVTGFFSDKIDPQTARLKQQLAAHLQREPKPPETKAQTLAENERPRKTHIHIRGDFLRKGDEVQPGTPAILHPFRFAGSRQQFEQSADAASLEKSSASAPVAAPSPANRLHLAQWLFDPANPLTARVTVNRVWRHLFGRGLVATLDDFGTRGEKPSHPELLDWLATEFPRLNWSRKALIKLIVTSATYRQSSVTRLELLDRDPTNVLLARQNRIRLEAETIRDAFLAVSGLLTPAIGGPSIRPPLPADIAALGYANSVKWSETQGADRYRRGLYIFFQRTVPYPMLMTFDAPDSNVTCTRRERSNTPLQALTLLNDPVFYECAQALGRRMAAECPGSLSQKIRRGFQLCFARPPTEPEQQRLEQLYDDALRLVQADGAGAAKIAGSADAAVDRVEEVAALVAVARTLLNLDEFVTRD